MTLVNDVNFMLYTPLLPGAAAGRWSRATSWSRCARSSTRTDLRHRHGDRRGPGDRRVFMRTADGRDEEHRTTTS